MAQAICNRAGVSDKLVDFQSDIYDSSHLMRDSFTGILDKDVSVKDILLAWLLCVPTDLDPADAATRILRHYANDGVYRGTPKLIELVKMLEELSQFNVERLSQITRKKRNRKSRRSETPQQTSFLN